MLVFGISISNYSEREQAQQKRRQQEGPQNSLDLCNMSPPNRRSLTFVPNGMLGGF